MFESNCEIRSEFLVSLKALFYSMNGNKSLWEIVNNLNLPKKTGIFQHLPLHNLYQNRFKFSKKGKIEKKDILSQIFPESKASHLVFVDGILDLSLSDLSKVKEFIDIDIICSNRDLKDHDNQFFGEEYNFFLPLNLIFSQCEVHLTIKENGLLPSPLQIIDVITNETMDFSLFSPRIFITALENSSASLVFNGCNLSSANFFWINKGLYLNIEKKAKVALFSHFQGFDRGYLFNMIRANLKQESLLNIFTAMEGAKIEHNDFKISLNEKFASCNLNGIFLLKRCDQAFLNVNMAHMAEETLSDQKVKSILKDQAASSFEAEVYIDKKAKKAECCQLNKNLILSKEARAFSKPFLKVLTDDVKAKHGATIHRLSEEDLFYLASRGLDPSIASYFLIKGFCQEIFNPVNIQSIRDLMRDRLTHYLG